MSGLEDDVTAEQEASLARAAQRARMKAEYREIVAAAEAEEQANAALAEKVMATRDPIVVAVRKLHKPRPGMFGGQQCDGCWEECLYCEGPHDWPCETILVLGRVIS